MPRAESLVHVAESGGRADGAGWVNERTVYHGYEEFTDSLSAARLNGFVYPIPACERQRPVVENGSGKASKILGMSYLYARYSTD